MNEEQRVLSELNNQVFVDFVRGGVAKWIERRIETSRHLAELQDRHRRMESEINEIIEDVSLEKEGKINEIIEGVSLEEAGEIYEIFGDVSLEEAGKINEIVGDVSLEEAGKIYEIIGDVLLEKAGEDYDGLPNPEDDKIEERLEELEDALEDTFEEHAVIRSDPNLVPTSGRTSAGQLVMMTELWFESKCMIVALWVRQERRATMLFENPASDTAQRVLEDLFYACDNPDQQRHSSKCFHSQFEGIRSIASDVLTVFDQSAATDKQAVVEEGDSTVADSNDAKLSPTEARESSSELLVTYDVSKFDILTFQEEVPRVVKSAKRNQPPSSSDFEVELLKALKAHGIRPDVAERLSPEQKRNIIMAYWSDTPAKTRDQWQETKWTPSLGTEDKTKLRVKVKTYIRRGQAKLKELANKK